MLIKCYFIFIVILGTAAQSAGMKIDEERITTATACFGKAPHSPVAWLWTGVGTKLSFPLAPE